MRGKLGPGLSANICISHKLVSKTYQYAVITKQKKHLKYNFAIDIKNKFITETLLASLEILQI